MKKEDLQPYIIPNIESKWFRIKDLEGVLGTYGFPHNEVGRSSENRPIYRMEFGHGPIRVLVWSQMHGNESTGTRAMLDLWPWLLNSTRGKALASEITLCFLPMLNPDGAEEHSRLTPLGIDMNRDFLSEHTPEIRLLKKEVATFDPDWMFNLHDQRTIFNPKDEKRPATLSLLAPSFDENKTINCTRKEVMGLAGHIFKSLQLLKIGIGRYTDDFYPRSTGDNFTKEGRRCLLFESGHFPNDYHRNQSRSYLVHALILGLEGVRDMEFTKVTHYNAYTTIPLNASRFYDVVFRNIALEKDQQILADCGIQYKEEVVNGAFVFSPQVAEIGDLTHIWGHKEVDFAGEFVAPLSHASTIDLSLFGFPGII